MKNNNQIRGFVKCHKRQYMGQYNSVVTLRPGGLTIIGYTGMCRPTGSSFSSPNSRTGYPFGLGL